MVSVLQCIVQGCGVHRAPLEVREMVRDSGECHGVPHQGLFYIVVISSILKSP